jgi:hypothetical protein
MSSAASFQSFKIAVVRFLSAAAERFGIALQRISISLASCIDLLATVATRDSIPAATYVIGHKCTTVMTLEFSALSMSNCAGSRVVNRNLER